MSLLVGLLLVALLLWILEEVGKMPARFSILLVIVALLIRFWGGV